MVHQPLWRALGRRFWRVALIVTLVTSLLAAPATQTAASAGQVAGDLAGDTARAIGPGGLDVYAAPGDPCPVDTLPGQPCPPSPSSPAAPTPALGSAADCALVKTDGSDKQTNMRAIQRRIACGLEKAGAPGAGGDEDEDTAASPNAVGYTDRLVNNATADTHPHVTQGETFTAVNGLFVAMAYNSSSAAPSNYSGYSYSTNGGLTYNEIRPSPFATGNGTNFGDPTVVFNRKLGKYFSVWLATGCGGQGLGTWSSTNGINWTPEGCVVSSSGADRESMWADNNPASPFYGRMYVSYNNFGVSANGPIFVRRSDTGLNLSWSAVSVTSGSTFIRNTQAVGAVDNSGLVTVTSEEPVNFQAVVPRHHRIHRSTDGGVTFAAVNSIALNQSGPGVVLGCGRPGISPIWRYEGHGMQGVGPSNVVHYAYTTQGGAGDLADIKYVRSTDTGVTWSTPIRLNTDSTTREQWLPALTVSAGGLVTVSWYDRRNTTNGTNYQRFSRQSINNGVNWMGDQVVSDVLIPQPAQVDPNVNACFITDYDYHVAVGNRSFGAWSDGRISIAGNQQIDVFADVISHPYCVYAGPYGNNARAYSWNAYVNAYYAYTTNPTGNSYSAYYNAYQSWVYADAAYNQYLAGNHGTAANYFYYAYIFSYYAWYYADQDYKATGSSYAYYASVYATAGGSNAYNAYLYIASYCV